MKFKDNIALVVGSATGMGRATVLKLVREGAHVIAFDLLSDELEVLKEELKTEPGTIEPFVGDVNDPEKRRDVIGFIKTKYGKLDTLAYIAGVLDLMTPLHGNGRRALELRYGCQCEFSVQNDPRSASAP